LYLEFLQQNIGSLYLDSTMGVPLFLELPGQAPLYSDNDLETNYEMKQIASDESKMRNHKFTFFSILQFKDIFRRPN